MKARFRDSPDKSLSIMKAIRYTIKDVRARKDPTDYVTNILIHSKNADLAPTKTGQVLLTYEHMNEKLRHDLPKPSDSSIVTAFINDLRLQKNI